ncbi:MAG TPA: homocysteine S-methyltransferase family protein [Anaeromyxobacter sp.]|nr:homocysteine S-methyltransferase family protein [Anaeromyxobacter sp.]
MDCAERLRLLFERRPAVCDGAMGTQLQSLGLAPGQSGEPWNADEPGAVRRIHQAYLDAGADLLITNTFGGTSLALRMHGIDPGRAAELNRAGARLAREVAGSRALVLGDVGPFGGMLEPLGDASPADVSQAFREQAAALLEGGADAILVETMSDPAELALAVAAARAAGARCVFATATFGLTPDGFRTIMGVDVAGMVEAALGEGADVVGANCGTKLSLDDYARLVPELVAAGRGKPVMVQPNAGSPELRPDGTVIYPTGHEAFAAAVPRFLAAGARIVGGCCGTGPAHIAAIAVVVGAAEH